MLETIFVISLLILAAIGMVYAIIKSLKEDE